MKLTIISKHGWVTEYKDIEGIELERKGNTFKVTEDSGAGFLTCQNYLQGEIIEDNED